MICIRREFDRWFREALWDLETAKILHRERRYNAAAFYSQQAAEKALKALLYRINEAPWGHSVRVLLMRYLERTNESAEDDLLVCARELDRHYIPSRYPNAHPSGTPHEAYDSYTSERAIRCAELLIEFVRKRIYEE